MSYLLLRKEAAEEMANVVLTKPKPGDFWRRQAKNCEEEIEKSAERYRAMEADKDTHFAPEICKEFIECEVMHCLETMRRAWAYRALADAIEKREAEKEEPDSE